ncbi:MAG: Hsp70 family protein [Elainellaceae cyanobacterium]
MVAADFSSSVYAIDFGTSNTVITRWNQLTQSAETVSLADLSVRLGDNPPLIPSLVYVEDASQAKILAGQTVRDRGLDLSSDPRFFRNLKRGIGTEIQGFLPHLDETTLTFEQVGAWFLTGLIDALKAQDPQIESLTFTVPVDSFEAYRHWLGQVSQSLQVEQVRMLDEPTAAALGYGLGDRDTVLVIDFGGGTLDLSLVQLTVSQSPSKAKPLGFILKWGANNLAETSSQKRQTAQVIAKAGQNLGGADIDNWLVDYFAATQGLPVTALTTRLAERLKIELSSRLSATESYFNDETLESYELSLDQEQFNTMLDQRGFFERLNETLQQVLRQARNQGVESRDIDAVLLVGGTAQIPAVRDWVTQHFSPEQVQGDRPFEAIAQGALQLSQGIEVKDFLYHSYGIRYWNRREKRHDWHPIIPEGQPYPMDRPVEILLGASVDNQPQIELVIGELGTAETRTEVFFDGDRLITRTLSAGNASVQSLNDRDGARNLATLEPLGTPGSDRIKLLFWVDADRFLRITVEDLLTNQSLTENQAVVQLS